jgi:hypothetical protein
MRQRGLVMIFGMSLLTFIHVVLSLIGIVTGFIVLYGLLKADRKEAMTHVFLWTTLATSLTGFMLFTGFTPAIVTGIVATLVLIPTIAARYVYRLAGPWLRVYVIGAVISLYLNTFVLVVQAFLKVPALNALAPTGSEPPFAIAQGFVLVLSIIAGFLSVRRFKPAFA